MAVFGVTMLSLNLFLTVALAAVAIWFWHRSLSARERANRAALEACERMSLQFLDGTVAFAALQLVRNRGWLRLRRTYVFDYTAASIERRQGFVVMLADRVESIGFAQQDTSASTTPAMTARATTLPAERPRAEVLDLAEWRRKHQKSEPEPPASRTTSH